MRTDVPQALVHPDEIIRVEQVGTGGILGEGLLQVEPQGQSIVPVPGAQGPVQQGIDARVGIVPLVELAGGAGTDISRRITIEVGVQQPEVGIETSGLQTVQPRCQFEIPG